MFAIGRYDPDAEALSKKRQTNKKSSEKRKKHQTQQQPSSTASKVVLNNAVVENSPPKKRQQTQHIETLDSHNKPVQDEEKKIPSATATIFIGENVETIPARAGPTAESVRATKVDDATIPCKKGDNYDDNDGAVNSTTNISESDDSSSVPSSSDSDDETPALQVIAPEQKFLSSKIQKRFTTNEGMDDFDDDDVDSCSAQISSADIDRIGSSLCSLPNTEVSTALHIAHKTSLLQASKLWKLAPFLVSNLQRDGYTRFFPIQALVIPNVIASERHAHIRMRDVCVSAPTGSGKTLAYVLPVLNALAERRLRRLRALVVLPSRDLASQVYGVFNRYTEGSDLKVGLAIGQTDFEAEQKSLVLGSAPSAIHVSVDSDAAVLQYYFNPYNVKNALAAFDASNFNTGMRLGQDIKEKRNSYEFSTPNGGRSAVDVLVCTPGRLMDHLDKKTPGFTLQHLRFLVIDEADRLVNQSYQNWIGRVVSAAYSSVIPEKLSMDYLPSDPLDLKLSPDGMTFAIDPTTWRGGGEESSSDVHYNIANSIAGKVSRRVQLRKLLFSATLTKDPQKLASLGLVNPKHFDAHHVNLTQNVESMEAHTVSKHAATKQTRYSVPEGLSEFIVECTSQQKPLVLLALLLQHRLVERRNVASCSPSNDIVVVFTSSLDSTHRLARLLQLLWCAGGYGSASSIAEFSSALNQKQRAKLLKQCNSEMSDIHHHNKGSNEKQTSNMFVVVCSDGMSRGMDIPTITAVINYDVPSFAKTYVHRCGRTARAGREGTAISILKGGQVKRYFKMRQLIDNPNTVKTMAVKKDLVDDGISVFPICVKTLRRVIDAETNGELNALAPLTNEWMPLFNDGQVIKHDENCDSNVMDDDMSSSSTATSTSGV